MQRCWTMGTVLACVLAGCSGSGDEKQAPATAGSKAAQAKPAKAQGPDGAVFDFLEAVRTGNDSKANGMLTQLARQKTAELDMVVAPPGSDTASFEVGGVEMITEGDERGAHVTCKWTDVGEDGQPHTDEIIWMLREEPEGWRIAGMATQIFDEELPLLLNFEDPEDMMRKQRMAEEEMERRSRPETQESRQSSSEDPFRK
ncbi:MAG: hypothetical protein WD847_14440 [Pirellulales bacterium]